MNFEMFCSFVLPHSVPCMCFCVVFVFLFLFLWVVRDAKDGAAVCSFDAGRSCGGSAKRFSRVVGKPGSLGRLRTWCLSGPNGAVVSLIDTSIQVVDGAQIWDQCPQYAVTLIGWVADSAAALGQTQAQILDRVQGIRQQSS